jgi:hypothetical protein
MSMALVPESLETPASATLSIEADYSWRRASDTVWHKISATEVADPSGGQKTADDALGDCSNRLLSKVLNK